MLIHKYIEEASQAPQPVDDEWDDPAAEEADEVRREAIQQQLPLPLDMLPTTDGTETDSDNEGETMVLDEDEEEVAMALLETMAENPIGNNDDH